MSSVVAIRDFDERRSIVCENVQNAESTSVNRKGKYKPWLNLAERGLPVEESIRHNHPMFNHFPKVGDWFLDTVSGGRVRIDKLTQCNDEIVITCNYPLQNKIIDINLDWFIRRFNRTVSLVIPEYMSVEGGFTPAEILTACNAQNNRYFRMALAVECAYGKWRGVFRKLNIRIPREGIYTKCPLCGSPSYHAPDNFDSGMCGCFSCGEHSGLDMIARLKGVNLVTAADLTLSLFPPASIKGIQKRIDAFAS